MSDTDIKQRIFFDLDGVLATWQNAAIEDVAKPGYFSSLPSNRNVVLAFKRLEQRTDIDLYILSSVFSDDHSREDKKIWVKNQLGLSEGRQIYAPYGTEKEDALKDIGGIKKTDVLIDDFSRNLRNWSGIPIKLYNGINGTHGTWHGFSVHSSMDPEILEEQIYAISRLRAYSCII